MSHPSATGPWDDSDIFRGERPPPPRSRSPSPSRKSTVSTSSSGSHSYLGGRLGAIAAVVELAISRWAGNESSSSSSSSSSDSDSIARSRGPRRSTHRKSEHDIATRISRMQAREESRQIPRHFALYLPSLASLANSQRITQTASTELPLILGKLDSALKKSTRARRQQERDRSPKADLPRPKHLHFMLPDVVKTPSRAASFTDLVAFRGKGKQKEGQVTERSRSLPKPWFLDVSSPNWDDMRAIGKLLHLHPLTLEDILMKDPREKLEHFPKLGYYFLSFRAIEPWENREKTWDQAGNEREVGEANVYLVVFNEGLCLFHFTAIPDHIDRVKHRLLENVAKLSSDWLAHGILDSIVDSFFPFLQGLEKEVMAIEDIVFSGTSVPDPTTTFIAEKTISEPKDTEKTNLQDWSMKPSEKAVAQLHTTRARLSFPWSPSIAKWRSTVLRRRRAVAPAQVTPGPIASTLHRMAKARRLVTSLSRLLASKSEVVAQLRKRLLSVHSGSSSSGGDGDNAEVVIYLGDVQDHILTLENALKHYERTLSQAHPLYISHIRANVAITKSGSDKAVIFLSSVSIAVLCVQTLIGLCSINVNIPHNKGRFNVFGIVIALAIMILGSYLKLVLKWWRSAKRRTSAAL
ncbi:hypothetical protein B0H15DRAFT_812795 [Mycena belliarum]|uniref:Uncharacterized protein n=1 Tax=Mycena belliarum TaxID=1033014 RepID=A0AAD6UIH1_9AGAR|nr:hypothetical protein B0H15DRAFT_812795 [Mycena belliae]